MRRVRIAATGFALLAALLTGCTATTTNTTSDPASAGANASATAAPEAAPLNSAVLSTLVTGVSRGLSCTERIPRASDLSVFDDSKGLDCLRPDGRAVLVRAYAHSSTIEGVVTEWAPTLGAGRAWTRGDNWVAFGPHPVIDDVARRSDGSTPSTTDPSSPAPVAALARDSCMGFVSGAAAQAITDPHDFSRDAAQTDRAFPGSASLARRIATPAIMRELADAPDYRVTAALSRFGDEFRALCVNAKPQTP